MSNFRNVRFYISRCHSFRILFLCYRFETPWAWFYSSATVIQLWLLEYGILRSLLRDMIYFKFAYRAPIVRSKSRFKSDGLCFDHDYVPEPTRSRYRRIRDLSPVLLLRNSYTCKKIIVSCCAKQWYPSFCPKRRHHYKGCEAGLRTTKTQDFQQKEEQETLAGSKQGRKKIKARLMPHDKFVGKG